MRRGGERTAAPSMESSARVPLRSPPSVAPCRWCGGSSGAAGTDPLGAETPEPPHPAAPGGRSPVLTKWHSLEGRRGDVRADGAGLIGNRERRREGINASWSKRKDSSGYKLPHQTRETKVEALRAGGQCA